MTLSNIDIYMLNRKYIFTISRFFFTLQVEKDDITLHYLQFYRGRRGAWLFGTFVFLNNNGIKFYA